MHILRRPLTIVKIAAQCALATFNISSIWTPLHSFNALAQQTAQTPSFKTVVARLHSGERDILLGGLPHSLAAFLLVHLQGTLDRTVLVVTADEDRAEQWRDDLQAIAGGQVVRYFPAWDADVYDKRSPDIEITGLRIEAAIQLQQQQPSIVVAPAKALLTPLIPPDAMELATLHLKRGRTAARRHRFPSNRLRF